MGALLLGLFAVCAGAQTMDRSAGAMTMRPGGPGGMWGGVERDGSSAEIGERLFRAGRVPGDRTADAVRAGNPVGPDQVACANCHGRSGQGVREGGQAAPPIHGEALATARAGFPARPAYTPATLARAIREGIAADGRALSVLMPRYQLSDEVLSALLAHLEGLRPAAAPGVTADEVQIATVVAGEVPAAAREVMLATLRAYADDLLAQTQPGVRHWKLQVWRLHGSPLERRAQLEAAFHAQPVAAIVGGLGDDSWLAVHQFCEQHALPCLFPGTALPPLDVTAYYSVYLDKGRALSGQLLARYLKDHPALLAGGPLVQVLPASWEGYVPANALRTYLGRAGARQVHDLTLGAEQVPDVAFWRELLRRERPGALVVWAPHLDLDVLASALDGRPELPVFVPLEAVATVSDPAAWPLDDRGLALRVLAHQQPLPAAADKDPWQGFVKRHALPAGQPLVCADTWFAAQVLEDALVDQPGAILDVDRVMSRVEYAAGALVAHPLRPELALGMGQRFAGKAGWILEPRMRDGQRTLAVQGGIITP